MTEYPDFPGFKAPGASADAAEHMAPGVKALRAAVLRTLIQTVHGLTADEIAAELRRSVLSIRPRVSELHRLGLVRRTDRRGRNESGMSASVWEVVRDQAVAS